MNIRWHTVELSPGRGGLALEVKCSCAKQNFVKTTKYYNPHKALTFRQTLSCKDVFCASPIIDARAVEIDFLVSAIFTGDEFTSIILTNLLEAQGEELLALFKTAEQGRTWDETVLLHKQYKRRVAEHNQALALWAKELSLPCLS